MSTSAIAAYSSARRLGRDATVAWSESSATAQTGVKLVLLVGATFAAYHYSLSSLLQTVGFDTPLAYIGLVPVIAALIAWTHRRPRVGEHAIHDRQLDYILGVPALVAALVLVLVLPHRMGLMYWVDRIDLLSLPVFVAGATILLFGTRVAWRQKFAIGYLLLAWPWPYTTLLLGTLGGFTSATLAGLRALLRLVPVARPLGGSGNEGVFQVVHHGSAFPVSVVTACSGVDGMVGFLLIGAAFASVVTGPRMRKLAWLVTGLAALWVANLARLLLIFWAGTRYGQHVAVDILHPFAGLALFLAVVGAMYTLLRPFGLAVPAAGAGGSAPASPAPAAGSQAAAPRVFVVGAVVVAVSLLAGNANSALAAYDPVATAAGEPRIGSFLAEPAAPGGWSVAYYTEYTANKPLFGLSSRWWRYAYTLADPRHANVQANYPVTADVINAGGLSGFRQYGVAACYSFHGYTLRDVANVKLGEGITGQAFSYSGATTRQDWTLVDWIWPVAMSTGTRYERIIIYLQNTAGDRIRSVAPVVRVKGLHGALSNSDPVQRRLLANRAFLVAFAREIVAGQSARHDAGIDLASVRPPGTLRLLRPPVTPSSAGRRAAPAAVTTAASYRAFWQRYDQRHDRKPAR